MEIKGSYLFLLLSMGLFFFLLSMGLFLFSLGMFRRNKSRASERATTSTSTLDCGSERDFQVFLNFRGPDSRQTVVDVLDNALTRAGIRVFYDDREIRKGEVIEGELLSAITNSRIYIPIFSRDYASSKWCLRELAKMMECQKSSSGKTKKVILPVFYDVDISTDVKLKSQLYAHALKKHKKELGEAVVKPWEDALKDAAKIKGWNLKEYGLDKLTKLIVEAVCGELWTGNEGEVLDDFVGIHKPMENVMKLLDLGTSDVRFVVIHGLGGIGKTTLARLVFDEISSQFHGRCVFLPDIRELLRTLGGIVNLQQKVLYKILNVGSFTIRDADDGFNMMKKRLKDEKVLIVLDNLDGNGELVKLIDMFSWLGKGSRIIITTRNVNCLVHNDENSDDGNVPVALEHEGFYFYEMQLMQHDDALKLFSKIVFRSDSPPSGYVNISREAVYMIGRLPLAIVVIGPLFRRKGKKSWKDELEKLKKVVHKDVRKKLMISIEDLDHSEREIFLDVACLFINKERTEATYYWEARELFPKSGINVLMNMSLIKIVGGDKLWMHELLRDLGRNIVHEENGEIPGRRSRLWSSAVALDVVRQKKGTEAIIALKLGTLDETYSFTHEQFSELTNLKFLELNGGNLNGEFTGDFSELRWLSWDNCPMRIEANLSFQKLVVLKLSGCQITNNLSGGGPITVGKRLKVLNLTNCTFFTKMFDFSTFLGLERLIIKDCHGLEEIDRSITMLKCLRNLEILNDSGNFIRKPNFVPPQLPPDYIGYLKCLTVLKISNVGLTKLHHSIGELVNLKCLHLRCPQLENLPDSVGQLIMLVELDISNSGIKELPDTIDGLKQLNVLNMGCSAILYLPNSIGRLESLNELYLYDTKIIVLPNSIGDLKRLSYLCIDDSAILYLPDSIGRLESLNELDLQCTKITTLPDSIGDLKQLINLRMTGSAISYLPDSIGRLESLLMLILTSTEITTLPDSIGDLKQLSMLYVDGSAILYLPDSIGRLESLIDLNLYKTKITTLPDSIIDMKQLRNLRISKGAMLHLPDSIGKLESLAYLSLTHVKITALPKLPMNLTRLGVSFSLLDSVGVLDLSKNLIVLSVSFLSLDSYGVADLSKMINFVALSRLSLRNYQYKKMQVDDLGQLNNLRCLSLESSVFLEEVSNLSCLKRLQCLLISKCPRLIDIQGLEEMESLQLLEVKHNRCMQWLPNLSNLKGLQYLKIESCRHLTSIQGLGEVETLESLDIRDNLFIQRLPDLSKLKKLRHLWFYRCKSLDTIPDVDEEARCWLGVSNCEHFDDYNGYYKKLKRKEGGKKKEIGELNFEEAEKGGVTDGQSKKSNPCCCCCCW